MVVNDDAHNRMPVAPLGFSRASSLLQGGVIAE